MTTYNPDKYEKHIARLQAEPGDIYEDWVNSHGSLFDQIHPNCGCLTQVRNEPQWYGGLFPDKELLAEIVADERIPKLGGDIRLAHLPAFAEWQRRLDKACVR